MSTLDIILLVVIGCAVIGAIGFSVKKRKRGGCGGCSGCTGCCASCNISNKSNGNVNRG